MLTVILLQGKAYSSCILHFRIKAAIQTAIANMVRARGYSRIYSPFSAAGTQLGISPEGSVLKRVKNKPYNQLPCILRSGQFDYDSCGPFLSCPCRCHVGETSR